MEVNSAACRQRGGAGSTAPSVSRSLVYLPKAAISVSGARSKSEV